MKRKSLLLALAILITIFAFVSCSGNVAPEDRLGTISFKDGNSRAVTTVIEYSSDVEDLVWFYKATKLDDGYTTGQTAGYVAVAKATSSTESGGSTTYTPTKGLSGKTLNSDGFSYGLWKIELAGYKDTNVTTGAAGDVTINGSQYPEYVSTINNHLVDKGATYASAKIEVGDNATTKIEFGEIKFEVGENLTNITQSSKLTLSVTDGNKTIYSKSDTEDGVTTYSIEAPTISIENNTVTVKSKQLYYLESGTDIIGDHAVNFVLSQELTNTNSENSATNTTIEAALYTLKFTVIKGTTTTISGTILKNDQTGTIQIDSFQDVEPITISKALDVYEINTTSDTKTAKVKSEKTISIGSTFKITYPVGALIAVTEDSVAVSGSAEDGGQTGTADAEQGIKRDDAAETKTIQIGDGESKETYQLTLASSETATSDNSKLVVVEFFYGKNREVSTVYHNGTELNPYTNQTDTESYSYNSGTGIMTLRVFHASPITVVTKKAVARVGEANYYSFASAIAKARENAEVTLLDDCVAGTSENLEYLDIEKNITIDLANKTLDLKDGMIVMGSSKTVTFKNGSIKSEKQEQTPVDGDYAIVTTGNVTFKNIDFEQTGTACAVIFVPDGTLSIIDSKFNCNAVESVISSYNAENTVTIRIDNSEITNGGTRGTYTYTYKGETKTGTVTPAAVSSMYGKCYINNSSVKGTGTEAEAMYVGVAELYISNYSTIEGTNAGLNIYYSTVNVEDSKITATKNGSDAVAVKQKFGEVTISGKSTVIDGYCGLDVEDGKCTITDATIKTSNTSDNPVIHVENTEGYTSTLILNKVRSNPDSIKVYSEGSNAKITSTVTNKTSIGGMTYNLHLANFSGYNN